MPQGAELAVGAALPTQPDLDGALVGGASLDAGLYAALLANAASGTRS